MASLEVVEVCCIFRAATRGDLPALLAIEEGAFAHPYAPDEILAGDGSVVAICSRPDFSQIIGYCKARRSLGAIEVEALVIAEEFRGRGLGRKALEYAEVFSPPLGSLGTKERPGELMAWVWERNLAAQKFFAACGFVAQKLVRNFYGATGYERVGDDGAILFRRPIGALPRRRGSRARIAESR